VLLEEAEAVEEVEVAAEEVGLEVAEEAIRRRSCVACSACNDSLADELLLPPLQLRPSKGNTAPDMPIHDAAHCIL
jgi:hypothetical protein